MKKVYLLCLAVYITINIIAQPSMPAEDPAEVMAPGIVRGAILDSTTQGAIEYATVGLYRISDSLLVNGIVTAENGSFSFGDIPAGAYYLDANFLGYAKKRIHFDLSPQRRSMDFGSIVLHPDITHIAEVQVIAQNQRVEYKVDKKVVNVAQDLSSAGGTLVNVLENTPSVEVDVEGNVSLRGSGNFQLLIDGKPSVIQGSEGLQQIPSSAVLSLEIITSPSAKYDPDGNAGIINVIMKKQKNSGIGGVINASIGTRNKYTSDFLLNIKRNKLNYFIGAEYSNQQFQVRGESERRTFPGDTTTVVLNDFRGKFARQSINLKSGFDYSINDQSTLSLSGTVGTRNSNRKFGSTNEWFTLPATKDSFFREQDQSVDRDMFYNINLDFQRRYEHPDHHLQASIYYSSQKEEEREDEEIRKTNGQFEPVDDESSRKRSIEESPERDLRMELDYTRPVGKGKFETGLQSRWDNTDADYIFEDYLPLGSEWIQNDTISNSLKYRDAIQSVYAIYSGPLGKFEYQAGLRAEYDHRLLEQKTSSESYTYENIHLFPSVFITRKLSDAHQIQFNYSRRIQRPSERNLNPFKDFRGSNNISFGNPELKPEFTNAFELNYQYTFKKGSISLETYYRETYDKITQINGLDSLYGRPVFTFTMTNADKDYSLGMELMTNIDLTKWWQLNLTGNLFRYQLDGDVDGEAISSVSTTWRTNFNTMFKMKWDTRLQITAIYNGPSKTLQGQRDGFFITNVAMRKELLKKQLTISLNARDIFSTGNFSFTSEGSTFYTYNMFRRESPVITLNVSYRLNNYRQNGNRRDSNGGGSEGGGMDDIM